jgi:hypothetical protein
MNTNEGPGGGKDTLQSELSGLAPVNSDSRDQVSAGLADVPDLVKAEARDLRSQATRVVGERAEEAKDAAVSHLDVFADALRAASDELGKNQSGPAAEMISNAASGLEGLTRSLHGQSTGQMIDTVRRFGRDNPLAFLAGSVLAGLALGRFASVATTEQAPTPSEASSQNPSLLNPEVKEKIR